MSKLREKIKIGIARTIRWLITEVFNKNKPRQTANSETAIKTEVKIDSYNIFGLGKHSTIIFRLVAEYRNRKLIDTSEPQKLEDIKAIKDPNKN